MSYLNQWKHNEKISGISVVYVSLRYQSSESQSYRWKHQNAENFTCNLVLFVKWWGFGSSLLGTQIRAHKAQHTATKSILLLYLTTWSHLHWGSCCKQRWTVYYAEALRMKLGSGSPEPKWNSGVILFLVITTLALLLCQRRIQRGEGEIMTKKRTYPKEALGSPFPIWVRRRLLVSGTCKITTVALLFLHLG